MMMKLRKGS